MKSLAAFAIILAFTILSHSSASAAGFCKTTLEENSTALPTQSLSPKPGDEVLFFGVQDGHGWQHLHRYLIRR